MTMRAFRYMVIPVFATAVFSYCLFAIISFMGQDATESYNFFVAFACAFVCAIVNCGFALRSRSVASVAILNGAMIALTEFFVFSAPNDIQGFWMHVIAAACFAAPVIHGLLLSREPVKASTMLLYCEFSISGTVMLLVLQIGEMEVTPLAVGLSVTALILNLFMLSYLRISGPVKRPGAGRKGAERGTLLIAVLAGIVFAASALSVFLLPASRNAVFAAVYATRDFFVFIGKGIGRFFTFLVSLMPAPTRPGPGVVEAAMDDGIQLEGEALAGMGQAVGIQIFIICAAIVLAVIVILIIRFRRHRLHGRKMTGLVYEEEAGEGWQLLRALSALPARLKAWLHFRKCLILRRGAYEEAYIRISRCAGRKGFRRAASETPRAFLFRVAAIMPEEAPQVVSGEGFAGRIAVLLDSVSAAVDRRLYSGEDHEYVRISAAEAETLSRFLAAIGR